MRLLFFTDTHIRGTNPRNRTDNFIEALKNKFQEIIKLSKELNIDYILHGGDLFDRPDISPSVVREFAVIIKKFELPIFAVAGNHDIFGQNPETFGRTMLGLLDAIGLVKIIKNSETIFLEKDGIKVQLTGSSYNYDIDGSSRRDYYIVKKSNGVDYAINIVHGMLLNKPFFEGIQYTLIEDILDTQADITLAGHYHSGFGIKKMDGKYFANPGSLVRISNSINEIERKPQIILIELLDDIRIKAFELESAQKGDLILDRTQLESSQDRTMKLFQFYQGLESSRQFERIDINNMINMIAANDQLDERVKDEAIRRIAAARESLSDGDDE